MAAVSEIRGCNGLDRFCVQADRVCHRLDAMINEYPTEDYVTLVQAALETPHTLAQMREKTLHHVESLLKGASFHLLANQLVVILFVLFRPSARSV